MYQSRRSRPSLTLSSADIRAVGLMGGNIMIIPLGILIAIGFVSGLTVYLVSNRIPQKVKGLETTE